jgi:hypothetical protein
MTSPVPTGLAYGCRDVKLTQYADATGTVLSPTSVDLPYIQHLNFTEAEEFAELRGDDKLITTRGKGSQVNWDLEAGGLEVAAWAVITGGDVIETGLTPNRVQEIRKRATQQRPWFRIDGKIISDSGGDVLVRIYRCRANGNIQANFQDGNFQTSQIAGIGLPLLDDTNDLLYSIFRRETSSQLTLTPDPNPVGSPLNLTAGAKGGSGSAQTIVLTWSPVTGATEYTIEKSTDSTDGTDGAWVAGVPPTSTAANVTETGLSAGTVWFRVSATVGGNLGDPCPAVSVVFT